MITLYPTDKPTKRSFHRMTLELVSEGTATVNGEAIPTSFTAKRAKDGTVNITLPANDKIVPIGSSYRVTVRAPWYKRAFRRIRAFFISTYQYNPNEFECQYVFHENSSENAAITFRFTLT